LLRKLKTQLKLKSFFAIISLLFLSGCGPDEIPECEKCKIYIGDSSREAMVREQDQEFIYANSEQFDSMIGMTDEGFTAFVDTYINGCKEWKTRTKKTRKTKVYKRNIEQIKRMIKKK
jgi:hypothetical protein